MNISPRPARFIYVDDSGAEQTGFATYSWVTVAFDHWRQALGDVLSWRAPLTRTYGIPKKYELHATQFANGRGNPSLDDTWNRRKANRSAVLDETFERFATWDWMTIGTIYSNSESHRESFKKKRHRVYSHLIHHLDEQLRSADEWGTLVMDGDGSDTSYISAHRELPLETRSLLEDPSFQSSSRSQWVQIADLVAYAAYQDVARIPEKHFAWPWYPKLAPLSATTISV